MQENIHYVELGEHLLQSIPSLTAISNSNIKFLIRTPATNFSILFMALFLHSQTHHLIISEILAPYKAFK